MNWHLLRSLDSRTGLVTAIKHFLYEDIPASCGWQQVFGSVALFCFLSQIFTGVLLAFNYAPTPGEAYNSVQYIATELTDGRLIRGLHHWGASMMIVIVVLHMIQVFLYGSYKKPREATWMAGVVLLLVTLAFGLTGYLLPWDNRAYWGTVVTTRIAAQAPFAGPYLMRMLGGEDSIGVVTFARFYALHVLVLPPFTMLLIAIHVYLVRKHGVAPTPVETAPPKKFYPHQAFKDTVAIFVGFAVLFTLAVVARVPLERLADPTDTTYVPRPEWYFLFLFQTLKFFDGPLEVMGSVVLPSLAVLALFVVPFIDRAPAVKLARRTLAFGIVILAGLGWTALTAAALTKSSSSTATSNAPRQPWQRLTPQQLALQAGPEDLVQGARVYNANHCSACHKVNGAGMAVGPPLNGLAGRRDKSWIQKHFLEPAKMSPGSVMPPYHLKPGELDQLTSFLLQLPATTPTGSVR